MAFVFVCLAELELGSLITYRPCAELCARPFFIWCFGLLVLFLGSAPIGLVHYLPGLFPTLRGTRIIFPRKAAEGGGGEKNASYPEARPASPPYLVEKQPVRAAV